MKKIVTTTTILLIITVFFSCGGKGTYYDQFSKPKTFSSRILDLNKSIDEIRIEEKGNLVKEDLHLLKYAYEVGDDDSYIISYVFDEKGCYEIGIDAYFGLEEDANNVVKGIKTEMNSSEYGDAVENNNFCRWNNTNGSISVELDYQKTARGEFLATIFANE